MREVNVFSLDSRFDRLGKKVQSSVRRSLQTLRKDRVTADIYLVADGVMRRLNRSFRRKDEPTNVLSFKKPVGFPHPENRLQHLGEIYLAPNHIRRRQEDIRHLAVHGLLHLLGYTHKRKSDKMKMERLERKLLTDLKRNA